MNYLGAEIFAKRRKRSEKWIVDQDQAQLPSTPGIQKTPGYSYQSVRLNKILIIYYEL